MREIYINMRLGKIGEGRRIREERIKKEKRKKKKMEMKREVLYRKMKENYWKILRDEERNRKKRIGEQQ